MDDKEWRYVNIRGSDCANKQKTVSVVSMGTVRMGGFISSVCDSVYSHIQHALGSRHEFRTPFCFQIASHITESLDLIKQRSKFYIHISHSTASIFSELFLQA